MSHTSTPLNASLTSSPLSIPPPLFEHISDPPSPLSLVEHIGNVATEGIPIMDPEMIQELYNRDRSPSSNPSNIPLPWTPSPPPMGQLAPTGYVKYDPLDPNHTRQGEHKIHLQPYGEPESPHYIHFTLDYVDHTHHVYGLRDDADPPSTPYGWPLVTTPFMGPAPSPLVVNNDAMAIFDHRYFEYEEVDAALYALREYGVTADVDHYQGLRADHKSLLARQRQLDRDLSSWRNKMGVVRKRLFEAKVRSHIHPYLKHHKPIPKPPFLISNFNPSAFAENVFSIDTTIALDTSLNVLGEKRPWYRNQWGVTHTTPHDMVANRCPYCHSPNHPFANCPQPHAHCSLTISCIIPPHHRNYGRNCPTMNLHLVDDEADNYYPESDVDPNPYSDNGEA
jgi:hypothetical protein